MTPKTTLDKRAAHVKILKFICSADKPRISQFENGFKLAGNGKAVKISARIFADLKDNQFITVANDRCGINQNGKQYLKRLLCDVDGFQTQHQELKPASQLGFDDKIIAQVNVNESPLSRLKQLRTKTGQPFLSDAEFQAGERLRQCFERSHMTPQITMNWSLLGNAGSSRSFGAGGKADISDGAMAARQYMERALDAVGPELSGLLLDICCFLKGLGEVERERVLPARSAKFMLKIALGILARHYGFEGNYQHKNGRNGASPIRHWGTDDYRPSHTG